MWCRLTVIFTATDSVQLGASSLRGLYGQGRLQVLPLPGSDGVVPGTRIPAMLKIEQRLFICGAVRQLTRRRGKETCSSSSHISSLFLKITLI